MASYTHLAKSLRPTQGIYDLSKMTFKQAFSEFYEKTTVIMLKYENAGVDMKKYISSLDTILAYATDHRMTTIEEDHLIKSYIRPGAWNVSPGFKSNIAERMMWPVIRYVITHPGNQKYFSYDYQKRDLDKAIDDINEFFMLYKDIPVPDVEVNYLASRPHGVG